MNGQNRGISDYFKMKYLVTGGAGFIGSHIVEQLVQDGQDVVIIDDLSSGELKNLAPIIDKIKFVKGDIRDFKVINSAMKGIDYVSHQAAKRAVPDSIIHPEEFNDVNINGTFNVLKAAHECNVKRVVFASSSSVYGDSDEFPLNESLLPEPKSPYAITKLIGEHYVRYFYENYGLETVSLRYFNVFGPRQDSKSIYSNVVPIFIDKISNDNNPIIYGDGTQRRDCVYVKDIVKANLLAFKAKKLTGKSINICSGSSISILELVDMINNLLGKDIKPQFAEARAGDVMKTLGCNNLAKELIGYAASVGFKEGLMEMINRFQT